MRAIQPKRVAVAGVALIGGLAAPLVLAPSAGAATITVTSTADDGSAGTLRDAFNTANTNLGANTIVLAQGATYDLTDCVTGGPLFSISGPLSIEGNGATIRQTCDGAQVIVQADSTLLTVTNVTVTGGSPAAGVGGGISGAGDVTVVDSTITGNSAPLGGGVGSTSGTLTITNSHIDDNSGVLAGGAFASGTLVSNGSTFDGNTAAVAGGINAVGDVTLIDSHADNNTGSGITTNGAITLTSSTVTANAGAGVTSSANTVQVTTSTVADNQGGGISAATNVTLTDSSVTGNTSTGAVGGVSAGTNVTATNSTITTNVGAQVGGISSLGATNLQYVTVAANAGPTASQLSVADGLTSVATVVGIGTGGPSCVSTTTASTGYNYEQTSNTCGFGAGTGDVTSGGDPLLLALAANGGPTNTHLFNTSSALHDAVPAASPLCTGTTTDQRGYSRPQGVGCDIGAVEMRLPTASNGSATTTVGTPVNTDLHPLVADPDGWLAGATYSVNPPPANGTTQTTGNGQVLYTPGGGFAGSDAYGYVVTDSRNVSSVSATINVTVTGTPPAPANPANPLNVTPSYTG